MVIIASLTLLVFLCAVWSLLHFCRKGALPCKQLCGRKRRRVHRYSPLADPDVMRMSTKSRILFLLYFFYRYVVFSFLFDAIDNKGLVFSIGCQ